MSFCAENDFVLPKQRFQNGPIETAKSKRCLNEHNTITKENAILDLFKNVVDMYQKEDNGETIILDKEIAPKKNDYLLFLKEEMIILQTHHGESNCLYNFEKKAKYIEFLISLVNTIDERRFFVVNPTHIYNLFEFVPDFNIIMDYIDMDPFTFETTKNSTYKSLLFMILCFDFDCLDND